MKYLILLSLSLPGVLLLVGCDSTGTDELPPDPTDTTPPLVRMVSPAAGVEVAGELTVTVEASDEEGVTRVELWVDGRLLAQDYESPWEFTWNARDVDNGPHTLQVKAYDMADNEAVTPSVPVEVANVAAVVFDNDTLVPLRLAIESDGGVIWDTLDVGERLSYSNPDTQALSYTAATMMLGTVLEWTGSLDLTDGRDHGIRLHAPSRYAFLYLNNRSSLGIYEVSYDHGDGFGTIISATFPPGERRAVGYVDTVGLLYIGASVEDYSRHAWVPGEDFEVTGTAGQVIELTYP